jgi:hypothetical protein
MSQHDIMGAITGLASRIGLVDVLINTNKLCATAAKW